MNKTRKISKQLIKTKNNKIKKLANTIIKTQEKEINLMKKMI